MILLFFFNILIIKRWRCRKSFYKCQHQWTSIAIYKIPKDCPWWQPKPWRSWSWLWQTFIIETKFPKCSQMSSLLLPEVGLHQTDMSFLLPEDGPNTNFVSLCQHWLGYVKNNLVRKINFIIQRTLQKHLIDRKVVNNGQKSLLHLYLPDSMWMLKKKDAIEEFLSASHPVVPTVTVPRRRVLIVTRSWWSLQIHVHVSIQVVYSDRR